MSMDRGISGLLKRLARQSPECVRVCVEKPGGIVALKGLMWGLMQRDNTGFVSLVPMSLVCV